MVGNVVNIRRFGLSIVRVKGRGYRDASRSPNMNAYMERFMRSIKEECLNRMIFFGENSLRRAVKEYLEHYHAERNHQGLENRLIDPGEEVGRTEGTIECHQRLGGMLNYYHRKAA